MGAGRPRYYKSPEDFDAVVDWFVWDRKEKGMYPTITGLCLALGFNSTECFYNYGREYEEFSASVKRARAIICDSYEHSLREDRKATGSIFALKNFGWRDDYGIGGAKDGEPVKLEIVRRVIDAD